MDFAVLANHRVKLKENEKKDKYLNLAWEFKKTVEQESDDYTNCDWCSWYSHQRIDASTGGLRNNWTRGHHPNYCIIKIGQNTEKSPGVFRKLAVLQILMKDSQEETIIIRETKRKVIQ